MATQPRTTKPKIAIEAGPVEVIEAPKSRWATMRDQARGEYKPRAPYMFDGTEPATPISAPDSVERLTALVELIDSAGNFEVANLRRLLEALCGDAFPRVWSVIKDEPLPVLIPLVGEINDHFAAAPAEEGNDLPGGA